MPRRSVNWKVLGHVNNLVPNSVLYIYSCLENLLATAYHYYPSPFNKYSSIRMVRMKCMYLMILYYINIACL